MTKYCVYLIAPGSSEVKQYSFDNPRKAYRFECSKLCDGWTGCAGPDLPTEIDVPVYEQLRLF